MADRSKHTWYVSIELPSEPLSLGRRPYLRNTRTFKDERDAKKFARAKLRDGRSLNAGTLNPCLPKRVITSTLIGLWCEEADRQETAEDACQRPVG
jgi:hypothetical protein